MNEKNSSYFILGLASFLILYFSYKMIAILSPMIIFAFIIFLLYPMRQNYYASRLILIAGILFAIWFFATVYDILFPFLISFVLAYLFEPIIQFFTKRKVSRPIASLIITFFGVGSIITISLFAFPFIISQLSILMKFLHDLPQNINQYIPFELLENFNVSAKEIDTIIKNIFSFQFHSLSSISIDFLTNLTGQVQNILSILVGIMMIPFLAFYFLNDFQKINFTIRSLVPNVYTDRYDEFSSLANKILRQYFRGQLIIVLILIVIYSSTFWIAEISHSLFLGLIFGLLSFIPYLGGIIALLLSLFTSLLTNNLVEEFPKIVAIYGIIHVVENFILSPKIIGKSVRLNPIILFLSIFLFGRFFGFLGIFLSVPIAAFLIEILDKYYIRPNTNQQKNSEDNAHSSN